jgi:hypothetical protein
VETLRFEIDKYEIKMRRATIWQSLIGAVVSVVASLLSFRASTFLPGIAVWILLTVLIFSGFALFVVRERFRLVYGVFELLIGIIVIVSAFLSNHFKMESMHFTLDLGIKISGGLYIMVRGQDNIIKAIKDTPLGIRLKDKYGIGK